MLLLQRLHQLINYILNIMVRLYKRSPIDGTTNYMDLPTESYKIQHWNNSPEQLPLIENYFPELTPEQREFILTGIIPRQWNDTFIPDTSFD